MKNIYHALLAMRNEARLAAKGCESYMYHYYNVLPFYPDHGNLETNALQRLQNTFIRAVNDSNELPRMILVFIDRDLLNALGREFIDDNIERPYGRIIDNFTSFVYRTISTQKLDLYNKRPGSVSPSEPKVIWVKTIQRYNPRDVICTVTEKCNEVLEESLASKRHFYVMAVDSMLHHDFFDRNFGLRVGSVIELWNDVDKQVELFDKQ